MDLSSFLSSYYYVKKQKQKKKQIEIKEIKIKKKKKRADITLMWYFILIDSCPFDFALIFLRPYLD